MAKTRSISAPHRSAVVRAGIITAIHCFKVPNAQITALFKTHPNTARSLYERVKKRAHGSDDILKLLKQVEDLPRPGRPPKFPPGSTVSERLREVSQQDALHQDLPHAIIGQIVSQEQKVSTPKNTADRILKNHHRIFRYRPRVKPKLSPAHKAARYDLALWALPRIEAGDIFIFSDELSIDSDTHRQLPNISRPIDADPYNYLRSEPETFQSFMFWGAIAYGYGPGPCHFWEKEEKEETAAIAAELDAENAVKKAYQDHDRAEAQKPGTQQNRILAELNANLRHQDTVDPLPSGRRRQLRRPEWEFKQEFGKRDNDRVGGADWARYRRTILIPKLYAWAKQIEQETGRVVWVIDDNAGPHKKARRLAIEYRNEHGIRVVNWAPRSPDLNKIEQIWLYIKDIIQSRRLDLYNEAGNISRELAERAVLQEWNVLPQGLINNVCEDFKYKLELVKRYKGKNNFKG